MEAQKRKRATSERMKKSDNYFTFVDNLSSSYIESKFVLIVHLILFLAERVKWKIFVVSTTRLDCLR